jgi:hypothetical protein
MSCHEPICQLNEALLALLPELDCEQQAHALQQWTDLDLAGRDALLEELRNPAPVEADLITLAKLADYFQCGVYDMVRYTRLEHTRA